jgi:hypothetical protein
MILEQNVALLWLKSIVISDIFVTHFESLLFEFKNEFDSRLNSVPIIS